MAPFASHMAAHWSGCLKLLTCFSGAPHQGKSVHSSVQCRAFIERCHRTKMNKGKIRELLALRPVYPGVESLIWPIRTGR